MVKYSRKVVYPRLPRTISLSVRLEEGYAYFPDQRANGRIGIQEVLQLLEGFFFVLPSRAGVRAAGPDEGIEICFGLEENCFAQLEKDEEFGRYAEQRGLGI